MSSSITIESINYDGEEAQVLFLPDNSNQTINLGTVILPFIFYPSLLIPPREVYGTYTIVVDSVSCRPNCTNIIVVPRPTPTPTPSVTPTKTPTPTPTKTPTPTPTFDPCKVPTPTPTMTPTSTQTPTVTPTPTSTCANPCGCSNIPKPSPTQTKTPTPTPTQNYSPC